MVARDPIRKVTLSAHPKFDGKKDGAERWDEPHVGSSTRIPEIVEQEATTVSGRASSDKAEQKSSKKGS